MSADLHLYVLPAHLEEDFIAWRAIEDTFEAARLRAGLPDFQDLRPQDWSEQQAQSFRDVVDAVESKERALREKVRPWEHENIWLGQISYMKAGLAQDVDRYIPAPLQRVHALMDPHPLRVLTDGLRAGITTAFNVRDESIYNTRRRYYYVTTPEDPKGKWYDRSKRNSAGIWFGNGSRGLAKRQDVRRFCQAHRGELVYLEAE